MAKSIQRIKAREMRSKGMSINEIADLLSVSKSSASIWCRDIKLTKKQIKSLAKKQLIGSYIGRIKGAETQKRKRIKEIESLRNQGIKDIGKLTEKEFFTAGVALYWGEGLKTGGITGLVNSDPKVILFMIAWFKKFCDATNDNFICRVGINTLHHNRVKDVEKYWNKLTGIPLSQFTKTGLYKSTSKKIYENHNEHYGTLRIKIRKGARLQRKILGWIEGLYLGGVAQWLEHIIHKDGVGGPIPPAATNNK